MEKANASYMKDLFQRLMSMPVVSSELLLASVFINILALASPLFVLQVLNRYVAQGVDATLLTLVSGVLIAISLEFSLRQARLRLARGVNVVPDESVALKSFGILTRARVQELEQVPVGTRREMVNGVAAVETAFNANNITTILDVPFSLILSIRHPGCGIRRPLYDISIISSATIASATAALGATPRTRPGKSPTRW